MFTNKDICKISIRLISYTFQVGLLHSKNLIFKGLSVFKINLPENWHLYFDHVTCTVLKTSNIPTSPRFLCRLTAFIKLL
jgi:hypothetical protein